MFINSARLFVSISIATLALATTAMTGCAAPTTEDPLAGTSAALAAKKAADDKCGCDSSKEKDEDGKSGSKKVPDNTGGKEGSGDGKKVPGKDSGDKVPSKEPSKDGSGSDCEDDDGAGYPDKDPGGKGDADEDEDDTCKDCGKDSSSPK